MHALHNYLPQTSRPKLSPRQALTASKTYLTNVAPAMAAAANERLPSTDESPILDPSSTLSTAPPSRRVYADRLGWTPWPRIYTATAMAFSTGAFLGISKESRMSALRFRAENSHRMPVNKAGWFFYHKAKNAYVAKHAMTEGFIMGGRLAGWVALFFIVEHAMDEFRDDVEKLNFETGQAVHPGRHRDFLATTVAGLTVGGAFSAVRRMPSAQAAGMCKMGMVTGLGFGLVQDAIKLATGGRLAYVDLIKHTFGFGQHGE